MIRWRHLLKVCITGITILENRHADARLIATPPVHPSASSIVEEVAPIHTPPVEAPVHEPLPPANEQPDSGVIDSPPAENPVDQPAEEPAKEPVEEPAEEPVEDSPQPPVESEAAPLPTPTTTSAATPEAPTPAPEEEESSDDSEEADSGEVNDNAPDETAPADSAVAEPPATTETPTPVEQPAQPSIDLSTFSLSDELDLGNLMQPTAAP